MSLMGDNPSSSGGIAIKVASFYLDQGLLSDGLSQYGWRASKASHSPPEETWLHRIGIISAN
jgi:hypothetical protein